MRLPSASPRFQASISSHLTSKRLLKLQLMCKPQHFSQVCKVRPATLLPALRLFQINRRPASWSSAAKRCARFCRPSQCTTCASKSISSLTSRRRLFPKYAISRSSCHQPPWHQTLCQLLLSKSDLFVSTDFRCYRLGGRASDECYIQPLV